MTGYHTSKTVFISIMIEHEISNLSPLEYYDLIKIVNKKEFAKAKENFSQPKKIDDQDCVEVEYNVKAELVPGTELDVTFRELIFLRNNCACRIRLWFPTDFISIVTKNVDIILNNISFI